MKKIGVLLENRFLEKEILYYQHRFPQAGIQVDFLTRLWGQKSLTFKGLEFGMEITADKSVEDLYDREMAGYAGFIMPAGYVADMLRYSEVPERTAPAVQFWQRAMARKGIIKGIICHGAWIFDPLPGSLAGRRITCHNNIIGSVKNAGAVYMNADFYQDGDLLSARTGEHFAGLAERFIQNIG